MTRASIVEYVEAVRRRYLGGSKKGKGRIRDEFTKVTGCHRKTAIRLFHRSNEPRANKKRGRPRRYGAAVVGALRVAWEATDRFDRLILPKLIPLLLSGFAFIFLQNFLPPSVAAPIARLSPHY